MKYVTDNILKFVLYLIQNKKIKMVMEVKAGLFRTLMDLNIV